MRNVFENLRLLYFVWFNNFERYSIVLNFDKESIQDNGIAV